IERGKIDLVVGTQALLEKDVAFRDLAMVVVDEQHKFGVLQRADFRTKGPLPHYLVMTATPIPRTLAMTVFGDLDVSIIREMPPGRGKTITKIVTSDQWKTVMGYVRQRLEAGEQAYVVCPLIGEEKGTKAQRHEGTALRVEPVPFFRRRTAHQRQSPLPTNIPPSCLRASVPSCLSSPATWSQAAAPAPARSR
ncbi:MAG: hypothetical protein KKI02_02140, partial [Planctomycetes bacterium]|nr:hypothetical protein [Planctomycetota bacterium]